MNRSLRRCCILISFATVFQSFAQPSRNSLKYLEGEWVLENMFSQNIEPGTASLQKMDDEFISKIQFTTKKARSLGDKRQLTSYAAKATLLNPSGKYTTYDAEFLDLSPVITLSVKCPNPQIFTIYICQKDKSTMWYSLALSGSALQNQKIEPPQKTDRSFFNTIGVMKKKVKQQ